MKQKYARSVKLRDAIREILYKAAMSPTLP
jgi:hypothetical protein